MKKLTEYLNPNKEISYDLYLSKKLYLEEVAEFYNNDIPIEIINELNSGVFVDYLYENLKTHDANKLKSQIIKEYPNIEFEDYESGSFCIIGNILFLDKLKHLVEFFGYYISSTEQNRIFIEPRFPKEMSDFVYSYCHGICYHITTKERAEYILKSGLRTKSSKYRKYPERIFLYCTEKNIKNDEDFKKLIQQLGIKNKLDNYVCLKMDLNYFPNHIRPTIMKDTAMKIKGAVFTYNNIYKNAITKTKILDNYK